MVNGKSLLARCSCLLEPLPPVVVEVARLKLLPRQPLSLKGTSMEPYMVKSLYENLFTKESTKEIQVHVKTTFLQSAPIGNPYFCPSTCTSFNSGT